MGAPTFAATPVNDGNSRDGAATNNNYPMATATTVYPEAPPPNTATATASGNDANAIHHNGSVEPTFYESALFAATNGIPPSQRENWGAPSGAVIPPPPSAEYPIWQQPKQGARCCGCCCDFRRAVIIVNCVIIAFSTYTVFMLINRPADMEYLWSETINDDQVLKELGDIEDDGYLANAIISGIGIVATIVPIYGAYRFDNRLVGFGAGFLILSFITRFVVAFMLIEKADSVSENVSFAQPYFFYTLYTIVVALFVYAHIGLMLEIRNGIMSPETYPREEYSCCCLARPSPGAIPYNPNSPYAGRQQPVSFGGQPVATAYPTGQVVQRPGQYQQGATVVELPGQYQQGATYPNASAPQQY